MTFAPAHPPAIRARLVTLALAVLVGAALFPAAARAELRTGHAAVASSSDAPTASFPGLARVDVAYEDTTGALTVTAVLRSALADPAATSALRSTNVEVDLATFFGDARFADSCGESTLVARIPLGGGPPTLAFSNLLADGAPSPTPVVVSPDRRTVTASYPADPRWAHRNVVCVSGSVFGPPPAGGFSPIDSTRVDGFTPEDGDVGPAATDDLTSELSFIHNRRVREGLQVGQIPGSRATCTPRTATAVVRCAASAPLAVLAGRPTITVRGARRLTLVQRTGPVNPGAVVRWRQNLLVTLRWRRCPRAVNRSAALGRRGCQLHWRWTTGRTLDDVITPRLIRLGLPGARERV